MLFVVALDKHSDPAEASMRGSPLRLSPYETEAAAKEAIAWQMMGIGFTTKERYVLATPDKDLPGVMRTLEGKPVLITNLGWTPEAFARFILYVWGS